MRLSSTSNLFKAKAIHSATTIPQSLLFVLPPDCLPILFGRQSLCRAFQSLIGAKTLCLKDCFSLSKLMRTIIAWIAIRMVTIVSVTTQGAVFGCVYSVGGIMFRDKWPFNSRIYGEVRIRCWVLDACVTPVVRPVSVSTILLS